MAIKIQGSVIIDDNKNIQDNTGFLSDANNSAMRPKAVNTGQCFMQVFNTSLNNWEDVLVASLSGITCNRSITVNSPYKYYGDGSSLTGISASNADTVDGFHATEGWNNSWCSRIPVVASNGVLEIGKFIDFHNNCGSNVDNTYRLDNYSDGNLGFSGSILAESDITAKSRLRVQRSGIDIEIGGENSIKLWGGSYQYIDFGGSDWNSRIINEVQDLTIASRNNITIAPDRNLRIFGVDTSDSAAFVMRLDSQKRVRKDVFGSSRRYKCNIENLTTESFDKIYNIVPVSFNYKEHCVRLVDNNKLTREGNYLKMGVVAEDIAEFMPEVVQFGYYDDQYESILDGILKENPERTPLSVNYESIFICAVGALQQLRQRVIDLEEEMQSLKASLQTP